MARRKATEEAPKITHVVGYVRVSTAEQAQSGLSLESQRARIDAQATANGWRLARIHEDAGLSAKTLDRPGLQAALADLRPGRILLALKLDRLTRAVADLAPLTRAIADAGAEWGTIQERFDTSTAGGRLTLGIMVILSEWERDTISERTIAALGQKRVRRERLGATPLGYVTRMTDAGPVVEIDEEGQATVARARELRAGGASLRSIVRTLQAEGRRTAQGREWHPQTVARLIEERYLERIGA